MSFILLLLFLVTTNVFWGHPFQTRIKRDYVPNPETARKIAEAIWLPIYGDDIYKDTPFVVTLKDSIWVVRGTLHSTFGGVPYIEIRKKDCRVLAVTHGK